MRVIGVDPGSRACGYGIVDSNNGSLKYVTSGTIILKSTLPLPERLKIIYSNLVEKIEEYTPDYMSIEEMFFAKNAKSAIKLGQARGVALLAAANAGLEIHEYAPTKVKLALTGSGRAKKFELQKMLSYVLGIDDIEQTDASDAIAIALCHINLYRSKKLPNIENNSNSRRRRRRFTLNDISIKG